MELILEDTKNKIEISNNFFNKPFNQPLIHQVVMSCISNAHTGSKSQKSRGKVAGSNRKPWKQKGTGRARAGSVKSPIWRSGGVTFAAKPKNTKNKINKKMYINAIKSIISELLRQNRLLVYATFKIDNHKTKTLYNKLKKINLNKVLIVINDLNKNLLLASRNIHSVYVCNVRKINPVLLISFDKIIFTLSAMKEIEKKAYD